MKWPFKYPRWQLPLEAAILEFDPMRLREKLHKAELAISDRLEEVATESNSQDEQRALANAVSTVRILVNRLAFF
jgi:hypothetical protein